MSLTPCNTSTTLQQTPSKLSSGQNETHFSRASKSTFSRGWPSTVCDAKLQLFYCWRDELCVDAGCVLWGSRLIVPPQGREEVMNVLHDSQPGIAHMKAIARIHIWWLKIDAALKERVQSCQVCQAPRKVPAPLHPWEWPSRPWSRILFSGCCT